MTIVLQLTCHALVSMALLLQQTPASLEGRWLFQSVSDTRNIPLFIAEITSSQDGLGGKIISTTAPFKLELQKVVIEGEKVQFDLLADGNPLTLEGSLDGAIFRGKVAGRLLSGNGFIAEKTTLTELEKPAQPTGEELEAFQNASQKEDPKEQIQLVQDFLATHPSSALKPAALMLLFHAALEAKQDDDFIRKTAEQAVAAAPDKSPVQNDFAFALAESGRLLDLAERYAREAAEQAAKGSASKANFLDTLGWVLFKKGDTAAAEERLAEALSLVPRQADVALHLAEVRESAGNMSGALDAYARAYVAGDRRQRARIEELYTKEKGSLEGLHQYLDLQYEKLGPLFDPGRYSGQQPGSPVVVELFTGAHCPPCQAADYAFDALLTHYPRNAVLALQYHLHIPRPDPMTNLDTMARARYYEVPSAPTAVFAGNQPKSGGGSTKMAPTAFELYRTTIEPLLEQKAAVHLELGLTNDADSYRVSAAVKESGGADGSGKAKARTLHVALVENTVHYTGSNGVHFHQNVVRKLLSGPTGTALGAAGKTLDFRFKLPEIESELKKQLAFLEEKTSLKFAELDLELTPEEMSIVAFVQENDSKRIVAAAATPLKNGTDTRTGTN